MPRRRLNARLIKACMNKTARKGGLDVGQMRKELSNEYPEEDFSNKTRNDLQEFCNEKTELVNAVKEEKYEYFKSSSELNEEEKDHCRCLAHNSVNDNVVCTGKANCGNEYDYRKMPSDEVTALINRDKICGMSIEELKNELSELYENIDFTDMKREDLEAYCIQKEEVRRAVENSKKSYFKPNNPLSEQEQRYCRCIAHVSAKGGDYNPYAVCTASVGRTGKVSCSPYYDYDNIPSEEVEALAAMKGVSVEELKRKSEEE